jgi:hypothetical protein
MTPRVRVGAREAAITEVGVVGGGGGGGAGGWGGGGGGPGAGCGH